MKALAVDLDGALVNTRPLWEAWIEDAARRQGMDVEGLPEDRSAAAAELDRSGAGNWRVLLERFAEDRAPVYFRRDAALGSALRSLAGAGVTLGVFTDAPDELARIALAHLGADRRVAVVVAGADARARIVAALGGDAVIIDTPEELIRSAS